MAEYNYPRTQLRIPVAIPTANRRLTRLQRLINKSLEKTSQLNTKTAERIFNRVLISINLLNASAQRGGVIGSQADAGDNHKQPRWRKTSVQSPCGICSSEVLEKCMFCRADRIAFHSQCLQSLQLTDCPLCTGNLDVNDIGELPDVTSCSKSVTSRKKKNDGSSVDMDASLSTDVNQGPPRTKRVCITMSTAADCTDINCSFDQRDDNDFVWT